MPTYELLGQRQSIRPQLRLPAPSKCLQPLTDTNSMIKHKTIPVEAAVPAAILNTAQATRPFGYRSGQALPLQRRGTAGFTLAELVVTVGVLVLLVLLFTQLLNTAATVTTLGHKKMGADSEARQLLDRMAIDFAQMVKRSDVDFFGKGTVAGGAM